MWCGRWAGIVAVCGAVAIGCPGSLAWADEIGELKAQMAAMESRHREELAQLQARIGALEVSRERAAGPASPVSGDAEKRLTALEEKAKKVPAFERFAQITWSGDFRLRYDSVYNQDRVANRHRGRARLRLGATYPAADRLEFGARLSSGGSTGDTGFATLGDRFGKEDFQLDRYYLRYRPVEAANLVAGKFENPFWVTQAMFDVDHQPEGAAATYTFKELGLVDEASVRTGFFTVSEISGDHDATMLGSQVVLNKQLAKDWGARTGLAHYAFHKLSPVTVVSNSTDAAGNFLSDFKEMDWVSQVTYSGWQWPAAVLFDYGHNFGAANGLGDDFYWVEASLGKIKNPKDWELKYEFGHIQQDAVVADFAGNTTTPETNMSRHSLYASLRVLKNTDVGLIYRLFQQDKKGTTATTDEDTWVERLQVDLTTKF